MPKIKKVKKSEDTDEKDVKGVVATGGEEEEPEKEGGALSDGVLDAFEETAPADPLEGDEETEKTLDDLIDEEDKDDMDYNPDEW